VPDPGSTGYKGPQADLRRQEEAEAAWAEFELRIETGRAEVDRCRSQTKANEFATFRGKVMLAAFLLLATFFLVLALVDPPKLGAQCSGGGLAGLLGLLGFLGGRYGKP
jgi:hypothetical protein